MQSRDREPTASASHTTQSHGQSPAPAAIALAERTSHVGNRAIARALPGVHVALSQAGNRAIAQALQAQAPARPGRPLQRKIRTIGEVDPEVRLGQQTLIEDTKLGGDESFEKATELKPIELEVLVGHGNENAIGGYDATRVTAAMQQKLKQGQTYNVIFFACRTGVAPARKETDTEQPQALSAKVQAALKASGYTATISAPKGILLVLGNKRYLVAEKFPEIGKHPSRKSATDAKNLVKGYLESLAAMDATKQDASAWERDVRMQQRKGWIKKVQPGKKTWHEYFKDNVTAKLAEITALDLAIPAPGAAKADEAGKTRTKALDKLERTLVAIRAFDASTQVAGIVTEDDFKKAVTESDQPSVTKRLRKLVGEGRRDKGETVASDLDQLGPSWQRGE